MTGLVEYPVVVMGSIDADFVRPLPDGLPPEVLATAMRTHQKYFSCLNPDGTPAPRFLLIANNDTPDGGKTIAAGNERVLRARLADARFFWDQDRKVRLEDRVEALKTRIYHEKLGSVYDKVERMETLAAYLADCVPGASQERSRRAAHLAKADLSTGMVGEFPELQGVMGRYYALSNDVEPPIANAVAEHYKPLGPHDASPQAPDSITVALADKIDALTGFFAAGERPTGSGDPYALRRAAQGVIRVILENKLRLSLMDVFSQAAEALRLPMDRGLEVATSLLSFINERLKVHLREAGIRHDLIAAAFEQAGPMGIARRGNYEDDLIRLLAKVEALEGFLDTEDGANLLTAYRRASNIVSIEQRKDKRSYSGGVDASLLQQHEELALNLILDQADTIVQRGLREENFVGAMGTMADLRRPIDEFFERVTVNAQEKDLRENRLRLLARIRTTMDQVADFSKIEG
ncbi:MAG TPA: glycine--tRNA ligase subunit beta [Stellaceae bacterium]|nr:glycine--tRNA ligase subunit beta [Stellaceae bacterium]